MKEKSLVKLELQSMQTKQQEISQSLRLELGEMQNLEKPIVRPMDTLGVSLQLVLTKVVN